MGRPTSIEQKLDMAGLPFSRFFFFFCQSLNLPDPSCKGSLAFCTFVGSLQEHKVLAPSAEFQFGCCKQVRACT